MGGWVSTAVRFPDGQVKVNQRDIHALAPFIKTPRFFDMNELHMRQFVETPCEWDHQRDWRKFAPDYYGLVVFDMVERRILDCQYFTRLNEMNEGLTSVLKDGRRAELEALSSAKRFKLAVITNDIPEEQYDSVPTRTRWLPFSTICALADGRGEWGRELVFVPGKGMVRNRLWNRITVDLSPWVLEEFDVTATGASLMLARLIDLGFSFSHDDLELWALWRREHEEMAVEV